MSSEVPAPSNATSTARRRVFRIFHRTFVMVSGSTLWSLGQNLVDGFMYILGVFLICFASVIISGLTYSFFYVILPMIERANPEATWIPHVHVVFVVFLLTNIIINYFLCITTKHDGPLYQKVIRELAEATGIVYPETPEDVKQFMSDFEHKMMYRMERRQARREQQLQPAAAAPSGADATVVQRKNASADATTKNDSSASAQQQPNPTPIRSWMIMLPNEWAFCYNSHQPKPPRSHFDHVTKVLVMNMDHYCPWMFNTVGYFNYRYFFNFLLFVFVGMIYGVAITFRPFFSSHGDQYRRQIQMSRQQHSAETLHMFDYVPIPSERTALAFSFLLCASVGIAVLTLFSFHSYLLLTAQTTIEFHGNCASKRRARRLKKRFVNPYDLGMKRNFQQVYGTGNPLLAVIVPSAREPEFLPLPIPGKEGLRPKFGGKKFDEAHSGPNIV